MCSSDLERGGEAAHTVSTGELPTHTHTLQASGDQATTNTPDAGAVPSASVAANLYGAATNLVAMAPNALANTGGSQPHENRQPFLALNFSIALQGIFPSST